MFAEKGDRYMNKAMQRQNDLITILIRSIYQYIQGSIDLSDIAKIDSIIDKLDGDDEIIEDLRSNWGEIEITYANALSYRERSHDSESDPIEYDRDKVIQCAQNILTLLKELQEYMHKIDGVKMLYYAVNKIQIDEIRDSGYTRIPNTILHNDTINLSLTEDLSKYIAKHCLASDPKNDFTAYVIEIPVHLKFLFGRDPQRVGSASQREYHIDMDELLELNSSIVGPIRVIREIHGGYSDLHEG